MYKAAILSPLTRSLLGVVGCNRNSVFSRPPFAIPISFTLPLLPKQQRMPLVTINQAVIDTLRTHSIFPDVIDEFCPTTLISVFFPSNNSVNLGNTLTPEDTRDRPHVQATPEPGHEDAVYTLVMTDPDAPSREDPKWSEYCHWILSDIKLPSIESLSSAETFEATAAKGKKEVIEYMGPAPPEKTGKHRYVFLLYRHGSGTRDIKGPSQRMNWGTGKPRHGARQWAKEHDLTLVAANFFFSENS